MLRQSEQLIFRTAFSSESGLEGGEHFAALEVVHEAASHDALHGLPYNRGEADVKARRCHTPPPQNYILLNIPESWRL